MGKAGINARTRHLEKRLKAEKHSSPTIDGYALSDHAIARMVIRGIEVDWVRQALTQPSRPARSKPGTVKRVGDLASVFVDPGRKVIVTVCLGRLNDEGIEEI